MFGAFLSTRLAPRLTSGLLALGLAGCLAGAEPSQMTAPDDREPAAQAAAVSTEQPIPRAPVGVVPSVPPPEVVGRMLAEVEPRRMARYVETLAGFGTRHTLSDTKSTERGIGAARRWIKAELELSAEASGRGKRRRMAVHFERHRQGPDGRRIDRSVELVNVLAVLPGTMRKARARRYYVIAHYDSCASDIMDATSDAPGANDDASGVAVVLELARIMSRQEHDATLVFMATVAEEQGLIGARLHAKRAKKKGLDVRGVLSNDIVGDPTGPSGTVHSDRVRVFSDGLPGRFDERRFSSVRTLAAASDSASRQLARFIATVAAWHATPVQPMLVFRRDRFMRGGDHIAFDDEGFAAVRLTEVEENYDRQHQDPRTEGDRRYGDLPEFVDAEYLADVARLNLAALAHLANAPSVPPNARILVGSYAQGTKLAWSKSPEPDVAGYEVVWRETTSAVWQHARDVGDAEQATLPINKDNYFVGVRAYDSDGYRSPVAFPTAARK
jgi:hypothetical protein